MVVGPTPQPRAAPTATKTPAIAAVLSAVTSRRAEKTTDRSARASVVNSRAGDATWNASLVSTSLPCAPRFPRRPMT